MQKRLTTTIADDNSSVRIDFLPASGASGCLTLDADQLLSFIEALGAARVQMVLGKPMPRLEGQPITTIANTRWYMQREELPDGSAMCFYHPGFGAVGFLLPNYEVRKIVDQLNNHLQLAREQSDLKPN